MVDEVDDMATVLAVQHDFDAGRRGGCEHRLGYNVADELFDQTLYPDI